MSVSRPADAGTTIENERGKEYHVRQEHGPWMIMVTSFRDIRDKEFKKEGLSAEQAAHELVFELRAQGIPAYTLSQDAKVEKIDTIDRLGNKDKRIYAAQRDMICVLAGNYPKIDDPVAQKTLAYIKKFRPKFMNDPKSGAVVRNVGNSKGPLAGAFLTINPNRDPHEVARSRPDNETKFLNSGIDFALVNLKHKYTLKVATYTGKSVVPMGSSKYAGNEAGFDKAISDSKSSSYGLSRAGEDATQLTYALRHSSDANRRIGIDLNRQLGEDANPQLGGIDRFESYVYHDKFQSIVTIGGFDSKDDPQISRLVEIFQAKYRRSEGSYDLQCETVSLPGKTKNDPPVQIWVFDPVPELIEVPRIK